MSSLATKLWDHQTRAFDFAKDRDGAMLAMEMGTGKSLVAVALADHWKANRIVIICPVAVLNVWRREFHRHIPDGYRVLILDKGNTSDKSSQLSKAMRLDSPLAVVVNYESAWRPGLRDHLLKENFDLVIFDESHRAKTPGTKTSRFCHALSKKVPRRLDLTGTPAPHSPLDLYSQFRMIDDSVFGTSFIEFKMRYAVWGGFEGRQVVDFKEQSEMREKFNSIAFSVSKDEALDLPEEIHVDLTMELGPAAMKKYKEMETDFYTKVENKEIVAGNALVKLLRLQQMTSGFVNDKDGNECQFDEGKKNLLKDILLNTQQNTPVVVFAKFKRDLQTIQSVAEDKDINRRYGEVSGRRKDLTSHAMFPEDVDLLGVQIQSGGVGIDLTRASIGIYYSVGFSLGDYLQSLSRIHRQGQKDNVTFYHLIAKNTVDEKVYSALQKREDIINKIIGEK